MAGSALLLGLPLSWVLLAFGAGPPTRIGAAPAFDRSAPAGGPGFVAVDELPAIAIPVPGESAASAPASVRAGRAPVVLPGYLLPDDGSEEAAHAGS